MEKYRAGIIGCGSIANAHARGYLGVDEIELVAIADPVEKARDEFKERYNIPNCWNPHFVAPPLVNRVQNTFLPA